MQNLKQKDTKGFLQIATKQATKRLKERNELKSGLSSVHYKRKKK